MLQDFVVRRRYSEFDSLRTSLMRVHPTAVVPPLPEKQTISKLWRSQRAEVQVTMQLLEHQSTAQIKF